MRKPGPIQRILRSYYQRKINGSYLQTTADLARPAIIFAPHPDDESLACGGTIIRKKQAGASVKVAFMTDGSASHAAFMPAERLREIRLQEAKSACEKLGLSEEDLFFFDFRDSHLSECQMEATQKIATLIKRFEPVEIFIPFHSDPPPDHYATYRFVSEAIKRLGKPVVIFEYPVWYWYHWPWVAVRQGRRDDSLAVLRLTIQTAFGARAVRAFNTSVDIQSVLEGKRAALNEHRSQMTRLLRDLPWPTLDSVSHGEFLARFFQDREYFYRYSVNS